MACIADEEKIIADWLGASADQEEMIADRGEVVPDKESLTFTLLRTVCSRHFSAFQWR